jgi:hypothetical protein
MAKNNRNRKCSFGKRKENTREERKGSSISQLLTFSFKDLDETQPKGEEQTIALWAKEGYLEDLVNTLKELSKLTVDEAKKSQKIKIYGDFPSKSKFTHPAHVEANVAWGVITSIGGQKGRVAGYMKENTFYIVFLDKNHQFWITEKKHT